MVLRKQCRDFADGFLSAADMISVYSYQIGDTDPRVWADYRQTTSPGIRAVQSYTLRDNYVFGDIRLIPESTPAETTGKELVREILGNGWFMAGSGLGIVAIMASLGLLPLGFVAYAAVERRQENRIRDHYYNLLQEINSV